MIKCILYNNRVLKEILEVSDLKTKILTILIILLVLLAACSSNTPAPTASSALTSPFATMGQITPSPRPSGTEPTIVITSPTFGQKITAKFDLTGRASVPGGKLSYRLRDKNLNILAQGTVNATASAPDRGTFSVSISFTPTDSGNGWLQVFDVNASDGSENDLVTVAVTW